MVVVVLQSAIVLCYPGLGQICDCSKGKKSKAARCGVVVWWWWWCGFITDNNTTLRLHWVTLGCGNSGGVPNLGPRLQYMGPRVNGFWSGAWITVFKHQNGQCSLDIKPPAKVQHFKTNLLAPGRSANRRSATKTFSYQDPPLPRFSANKTSSYQDLCPRTLSLSLKIS